MKLVALAILIAVFVFETRELRSYHWNEDGICFYRAYRVWIWDK